MGGIHDGLLGTQAQARPDSKRASGGTQPLDVFGAGDPPGVLGIDVTNPIPLDVSCVIARVTKDWDPPNPTATPEITVNGSTLAEVGRQLDRLPEWGQAGGSLRTDAIPAGTSTNLTVNLHANLRYRLPSWTRYSDASKAAQAEWDKMFAKLKAREDRHLAIAIEEADNLAQALAGHDIADITTMVTAANRRMQSGQVDLDTDTDHGAKSGVPYGDVVLDTTIR
jgi:Bacterial protein of unknown function (DUF922)